MSPPKQTGYQVDVAYPGLFHRETMPGWLHAVATALGRVAPAIGASFDYCELGCGDGLNLLMAAALHPQGHFVGLDLDATHIELARASAQAAGLSNVAFIQGDVAQPPSALSTGGFDYVVSHGMWAWIPDDVRAAGTRLANDLLRPGGIAYIGYMSQPGGSMLAPLQRLMYEVAATVEGDTAQRAVQALTFVRRLADAGVGLFSEHPGLVVQLRAMAQESPAYLAHEFLSGHWQPLHAAEVLQAFEKAGATWIGSATPLENIDVLSLPGRVLPLVREARGTVLAETIKDAARHQSLRRDLFQRGDISLQTTAHMLALDAITWAAVPGAPAPGEITLSTRIGPVQVPVELSDPVLKRLADGVCGHAELRQLPPFTQRPDILNQLMQSLLWAGYLHPVCQVQASSMQLSALSAELDARDGRRWKPWAAGGTAIPTSV